MNLKTILFLKAASGEKVGTDLPFQFSAQGGNGDATPKTTNSYGTTISTTSAENNSVTVTQVYDPEQSPTSYRNGYVNVFFHKLNDFLADGKVTFTADVSISENPASVTELHIYIGNKVVPCSFADGTITAAFTDAVASEKKYIEVRCSGCSFTLSNCKITDA